MRQITFTYGEPLNFDCFLKVSERYLLASATFHAMELNRRVWLMHGESLIYVCSPLISAKYLNILPPHSMPWSGTAGFGWCTANHWFPFVLEWIKPSISLCCRPITCHGVEPQDLFVSHLFPEISAQLGPGGRARACAVDHWICLFPQWF